MGRSTEKHEEKHGNSKKRVFKNFAEYWHYIKILSQDQREIIGQSLSMSERRSLFASFKRGGWNDLMMRNTCDQILDAIQNETGVDLLEVKCKIISGKPQLIQSNLWIYINKCFEGNVEWEHCAYILDGIYAEEFDQDYTKLTQVMPN